MLVPTMEALGQLAVTPSRSSVPVELSSVSPSSLEVMWYKSPSTELL